MGFRINELQVCVYGLCSSYFVVYKLGVPYKDPHSSAAIESQRRRCARWYAKNQDRARAMARNRYAENPDKERERNREWRNFLAKEKRCVYCGKERDRGDKQLCAACAPIHAAHCKEVHDKVRRDAFNAYGGPQCACCGTLVDEFLTMDHIDGGGAAHRAELRGNKNQSGGGGLKLYYWLKRNNYPP